MRLQWQELCKCLSQREEDTGVDEEAVTAHLQACRDAIDQTADNMQECSKTVCDDM